MQEPKKPLNAIAHELLTGKPCEYDEGKWVAVCKFNPYCGGWDIEDVPQYDTDIAAAWQLVEVMRASGAWVEMVAIGDTGSTCQITYLGQGIVKRYAANRCQTMPLAITTTFVEACKPEESQ